MTTLGGELLYYINLLDNQKTHETNFVKGKVSMFTICLHIVCRLEINRKFDETQVKNHNQQKRYPA